MKTPRCSIAQGQSNKMLIPCIQLSRTESCCNRNEAHWINGQKYQNKAGKIDFIWWNWMNFETVLLNIESNGSTARKQHVMDFFECTYIFERETWRKNFVDKNATTFYRTQIQFCIKNIITDCITLRNISGRWKRHRLFSQCVIEKYRYFALG